jgi:predicted amidohydrolase
MDENPDKGRIMNNALTVALAQISARKGDVAANIQNHLRMMEAAHRRNSDYIVFPELSLTGYEPTLANELAFDLVDGRLDPLREGCCRLQMTAIAGAPIRHGSRLILGSFILFPDGSGTVYSKRFLHAGEEIYFNPHDWNPLLLCKSEVVSLAICADTGNPLHAKAASDNHSTVYLASVLSGAQGYSGDVSMLKSYARQYHMTVMLANYCGSTGGYEAAGRSTIIDAGGNTLATLSETKEEILVASREPASAWCCRVVAVNS